jgi:hypothetical protein
MQQEPHRRPARRGELGVALQQHRRVVARERDQLLVRGQIGEPELRRAGLARAQRLAAAAQIEIGLGDHEPIVGG